MPGKGTWSRQLLSPGEAGQVPLACLGGLRVPVLRFHVLPREGQGTAPSFLQGAVWARKPYSEQRRLVTSRLPGICRGCAWEDTPGSPGETRTLAPAPHTSVTHTSVFEGDLGSARYPNPSVAETLLTGVPHYLGLQVPAGARWPLPPKPPSCLCALSSPQTLPARCPAGGRA